MLSIPCLGAEQLEQESPGSCFTPEQGQCGCASLPGLALQGGEGGNISEMSSWVWMGKRI